MTMPFKRSVGPLAYGTGALNVPLPAAYEVDDILVLVIATAYGEGISAVGWQHAPDSPAQSAAGGARVNVLWRRATGSESAITTDSGDHQVARIVAFGSVINAGNPWDVTNQGYTGATTAITIPGDTSTQPDGLAVIATAVAQDLDQEGFISGWTNTDLANIEEIFDSVKDVGSGGGIALVTGEKAAAGSIGNTTATQQAAGHYVGWFGVLIAGTDSAVGEGSASAEAPPSEEPEVPPDEYVANRFAISTWQFDTPEPDPADRDPISYYLAYQLMDQGSENRDKVISAVRVTAKATDAEVTIHAASPGDEIDKTDIEDGVNYRARATFADSNEVTRYERVKLRVRNLSIWTIRYAGIWDGLGSRDRLDELVVEGRGHGVQK